MFYYYDIDVYNSDDHTCCIIANDKKSKTIEKLKNILFTNLYFKTSFMKTNFPDKHAFKVV